MMKLGRECNVITHQTTWERPGWHRYNENHIHPRAWAMPGLAVYTDKGKDIVISCSTLYLSLVNFYENIILFWIIFITNESKHMRGKERISSKLCILLVCLSKLFSFLFMPVPTGHLVGVHEKVGQMNLQLINRRWQLPWFSKKKRKEKKRKEQTKQSHAFYAELLKLFSIYLK